MHRRPAGKAHGGLWEFPGGKIEKGETPRDALVREVKEELTIQLDPGAIECVGQARSGPGTHIEPAGPAIVISLYNAPRWSGKPRNVEGGGMAWFPICAIAGLELAPLDRELLTRLQRFEAASQPQ